jgi:hypothetical protein
MSEKLLDLAVEEACNTFKLPADHFLRNSTNITAAKKMIAGDAQDVGPEKAWLYSIVCNKKSGACHPTTTADDSRAVFAAVMFW